MISDRTKLRILGVSFFGCLFTFFTSSSRMMAHKDLGTIKPQLNRYCKEPREQAKNCLQKQEDDKCASLLKQASKCEEAAQKAYSNVINLGGCAREIQAVTICEVEWCDDIPHGDGKAQEACQNECFAVRQALDSCAKRHVLNYFERFGLEENGTTKLQ
mmetsp:Transcript_31328/g.56778  ORF Transcript_31328/g.56778 Transcript_31328/m.56778 type:complete len:159 (-) Transcript_31328:341-817(-)